MNKLKAKNSSKNTSPDTLFDDNFPFLKTDQELKQIKNQHPKYSGYYIASHCLQDRKEKFDAMWKIFQNVADSHFLQQYKSQFHERSWEIYVGASLILKGFDISSNDVGPDFSVKKGKNECLVEAVAPTKGDNENKVPDLGCSGDVPTKKIIQRITTVFSEKYKKLKKTLGKNFGSKPLVLAINVGSCELAPTDEILILRALFSWPVLTINDGDETYPVHQDPVKKNGNDLNNFFTNSNYKEISGILYSPNNILNTPCEIGSDLIFVQNPFAAQTIPRGLFKFRAEWIYVPVKQKDVGVSTHPHELQQLLTKPRPTP